MISFKDFLLEKPMNMKTYSRLKTIADGTALVGCEYEMLIPADSKHHRGIKSRSAIDVNDVDYSDLEEYFELSNRDHRIIDDDFQEWYQNKLDEWIEDNYQKYIDDEEYEEDEYAAIEAAKEIAREKGDEKLRRDLDEDEWFKEEFRKMSRFVDHYNLDPRYGWEDEMGGMIYDEEENGNHAYREVSQNAMADILGIVNRETGIEDEQWRVESDSSIEGNGTGIEVISPPQKVSVAIDNIKKMFEFMNNHAATNESTGFHINVSVPNIKNVNRVKLLMFLGEKYVLELFNRTKNTFTKSQVDNISRAFNNAAEMPTAVKDIEQLLSNAISEHKYNTVNFIKLKSDYLEFRIAGGSNYHKKLDDVINAVHRYITALEIACDPEAEKQEYYKKLSKMLTNFLAKADKPSILTVMKKDKIAPFGRLVNVNPSLADEIERAVGPLGGSRSEDETMSTFTKILGVYQRYKMTPTLEEKMGLRKFFFKLHSRAFKNAFMGTKEKVNLLSAPSGIMIRNPDLIRYVKSELTRIGAL